MKSVRHKPYDAEHGESSKQTCHAVNRRNNYSVPENITMHFDVK